MTFDYLKIDTKYGKKTRSNINNFKTFLIHVLFDLIFLN